MYRSPAWLMFLTVGFVAPVAALVATFLSLAFLGVQAESHRPNYGIFYPASAFTALVVGLFLWWLVIVKQKHVTPRWGVGVGIMTSLLAHPCTWLSALILANVMGNGGLTWLSVQEVTVYHLAGFLIVFTVESLLFIGWITTIVGGIFGWVLGSLFLKRTNSVL